jgi:formamidopyrimidine-DNA glycosylase
MPELPDLVALKRYFDATALHQGVRQVSVSREYILGDLTPRRLAEAVTGRAFESTTRYGKNLLIRQDGPPWIRMHFGMTGSLRYYKHGDDEPEYCRVRFSFENGYHLAYVSQRLLGRVSLTPGPEAFVEEEGLGPDARRISREEFTDIVQGRRGMLKSTLMNQHVIAGLGNVYVDEVLFHAGLRPRDTIDTLNREDLRQLYETVQEVLETSIELGSDARDFPADWLVHSRGEGEACPGCGGTIEQVKVSQRSSYVCPRCQPRR